MSDNQRRFTRVDFVTEASLETDGRVYPAVVLNLSLRGALLEVSDLVEQPVQPSGTVRFQLKGSHIELRFRGVLVHRRGALLGYRFDEVDQESMIHLRALLEYNLGDAERIRDEVYKLVED